MPDLSIAYKILLECSHQVNIFDWLTAFKTIVEPDDAEEDADDGEIPPEIQ